VKNQNVSRNDLLNELVEKYKGAPDLILDQVNSIDERTRFGDQLIHIVSVSGNAKDIETLITLGADVNSIGEDGYTPLHYAAEQGHLDVVKVLISNGADCDLRDKNGETAQDKAEGLGINQIVEYFSYISLHGR
jgi:ankyrin repeat protein